MTDLEKAKRPVNVRAILKDVPDVTVAECPTCGAKMIGSSAAHLLFDKLCQECGQALDWSDYESN